MNPRYVVVLAERQITHKPDLNVMAFSKAIAYFGRAERRVAQARAKRAQRREANKNGGRSK